MFQVLGIWPGFGAGVANIGSAHDRRSRHYINAAAAYWYRPVAGCSDQLGSRRQNAAILGQGFFPAVEWAAFYVVEFQNAAV